METLKRCLSKAAAQGSSTPAKEQPRHPQYFASQEEEDVFNATFDHFLKRTQRDSASTVAVGRFYFGRADQQHDPLQEKLLEVSREMHLTQKTVEAIENEDLALLWSSLQKFGKKVDGHISLDYGDLCQLRLAMRQVSPNFEPCFSPSIFARLPRDREGRVTVDTLMDLALWKIHLYRLRLSLCLEDALGNGTLSEEQLQSFIMDQIPVLPQLRALDESFFQTYVVLAARKFFFFLDPNRRGVVKIQDVMASDIISEFRDLKEEHLEPVLENSNWFSVSSVTRVHAEYLELDADRSGLLDEKEFLNFRDGCLTPAIVSRVFQECTSYRGQIDYKVYLDFVLATSYLKSAQALKYFFRLLDVRQLGYIDAYAINFFWKSMMQHPTIRDFQPIDPLIAVNEIFDMIKPAEEGRITLNDLIRSGKGADLCSLLTDTNGFLAYESRDDKPADDEDDGENF